MNLEEFYKDLGGDYSEMLSRFQSDDRIRRFLGMLSGDDSMSSLTAAVQAGDAQTAFRAVHTLKGVSLNLGLGSLAAACSAMTEALRGSDKLPEDPALYENVCREYARVGAAMERLNA